MRKSMIMTLLMVVFALCCKADELTESGHAESDGRFTFLYDSICGDKYVNGRIYDQSLRETYEFDIPTDCFYEPFRYLGKTDGKQLFKQGKYFFFSDGKCLKMKSVDISDSRITSEGNITLHCGLLHLTVPAESLHRITDNEIHRLRQAKRWYAHTTSFDTVCVDTCLAKLASTCDLACRMTYPIGNSQTDADIRDWLGEAMMKESVGFFAKEKQLKRSRHTENLQAAFLDYAEQINEYKIKEADGQPTEYFYLNIEARPIVENDRYITYYFYADMNNGGAHGNVHNYYRSYDKKLNVFLAGNTVIKRRCVIPLCDNIRNKVANALERWHYDFSCFVDYFPCGGWSGNKTRMQHNVYGEIPLQHLAILPEGIAVSYHSYNVGGFADDIDILVPFSEMKGYMQDDYSSVENEPLDISDFIDRCVETF